MMKKAEKTFKTFTFEKGKNKIIFFLKSSDNKKTQNIAFNYSISFDNALYF